MRTPETCRRNFRKAVSAPIRAALGKPVVTIYGLSDPRITGPINSQVRFLVPDGFTGVCQDWIAGGAAIRMIAPERVMDVLAAVEQLELAK
jgi:Glycosyltransferase family 9 (heptosyltransferase)